MIQLSILPDSCKSSNFERRSPRQCLTIPFVPTKSSAPEGLPVNIKISEALIVSHNTFHGDTGEQYIKLMEDFKSIVHKKGLWALFQKLDVNRKACQAELDLH